MPYCAKCGAELDKDAKFCPVCGTDVSSRVAEPEGRRWGRPISILAIVLIVLVVSAGILCVVTFSLFNTIKVDVAASRDVPYQTGVEMINLDFLYYFPELKFVPTVGSAVNIVFEELSDKLVTLNVSATGRANIQTFDSKVGSDLTFGDVFDLYFRHEIEGHILTVTSDVEDQYVQQCMMPERWASLSVTCDISIDPSMNASLHITSFGGDIVLDTRAGVVLTSLSLNSFYNRVEASLVEGSVVSGDVSVESKDGGINLSWDNVILTKDIQITATSSTYKDVDNGVEIDIKQHTELLGNVTLSAQATTGNVNFAIDIGGDVGANLETATSGTVRKTVSFGFSAPEDRPVRSTNYPAGTDFEVSLRTTTGRIDIVAEHTP